MSDQLQAAFAAIAEAIGEYPNEQLELIAVKCKALVAGYAARYPNDHEYIPAEVEQLCTANLSNPQTGRASRTFRLAGKLDAVLLRGDSLVLMDHKTCSEDITDPAGTYWRHLTVEAQPSHYMLLKWLNGCKLDEAMWDVMRKPTTSPKQLKTKAEHALIVANGTYCGVPVSRATRDWLQTNNRENLEMYGIRLGHDCTEVRPEWYFQRRTIPRLDSELLAHAGQVWDMGKLILDSRRLDRWPRHSGQCMAYRSPCAYLGICSGMDTPDSEKWCRKKCVHGELPDLDGDGRDTLTYSSLRTYETCPRKYFYRYELGLERIDEGQRESLLFGSLWHTALESYWRFFMPAEEAIHGNCNPATANSVVADAADQTAVPF